MGWGERFFARTLVSILLMLEMPLEVQGLLRSDILVISFNPLAYLKARNTAAEVWRLYRQRADSENRIQELKQDFGQGKPFHQ